MTESDSLYHSSASDLHVYPINWLGLGLVLEFRIRVLVLGLGFVRISIRAI